MIKSSKCEKLKKKQFNIFILPGVCIVCIMDTVTKKKKHKPMDEVQGNTPDLP